MRSLTVLVGSIKIYNCFFFVGQADRGFTTSQRSFQADAVASLAPPPRPCSAMPAVAGGPSSSDSQWNAPVADSVVDDDRWGGARDTASLVVAPASVPHPPRRRRFRQAPARRSGSGAPTRRTAPPPRRRRSGGPRGFCPARRRRRPPARSSRASQRDWRAESGRPAIAMHGSVRC